MRFSYLTILILLISCKAFCQLNLPPEQLKYLLKESHDISANLRYQAIKYSGTVDVSAKHIGELVSMSGCIIDGKIERYNSDPTEGYELLYMSGNDRKKPELVLIMKMHDLKNNKLKIFGSRIDFKGSPVCDYGVTGKLFLYQGLPAILMDENDLSASRQVGIVEIFGDPPLHYDFSKDPASKIYPSVEKEPAFPGGIDSFYRFVQKNLRYPQTANKVGGKVFVGFVVERDGSFTDVRALRSPGREFSAEAVRMVRLSPKWNPGYNNGKKVRCSYTVPIIFLKVK
jgi:TonB family protein